MFKRTAIEKFLSSQPYYMAKLYEASLEVQVNVSRGAGDPISGSYGGIRWQGYTDGLQTWKHFRIPWKAAIEPTYEDQPIKFDIRQHAEAIGLTGWDWIKRQSRWVGFDFDSIIGGHTQGLTVSEINQIQIKLEELPFIWTFTSTSGLGLHIYTFIHKSPVISNHTEHAAVARAILSKISSLTGLELEAKVDALGGNMWVWHRRAIEGKSYDLLKEGIELDEVPPNWRDYLIGVRTRGKAVQSSGSTRGLEQSNLIASKNKITLDKGHIKLLKYLDDTSSLYWYDDEKQMLVCHTYDLKQAHVDLSFKGFFETLATGKDHGQDQNCFCFPLYSGGWIIRRHTRGCGEHTSWFTDNSGWTSSYFNRLPSLKTASKLVGGIEGEKLYTFKLLSNALKALLAMEIDCPCPPGCENRPAQLQQLVDGRLKVSFLRNEHDTAEDWGQDKKGKVWERYFFRPRILDESDLPDELVRHVTIGNAEFGWYINTNNSWTMEKKTNVVSVLISKGRKRNEVDELLGQCILQNWELVNKPFKPEYPGNREWNRGSPQLRHSPQQGEHPYWDKILGHIGKNLEEGLYQNEWSKEYGILTGILYLQAWCASFIQNPGEPLPYLFLYGNQNTGKSIFHEALSTLFTSGYCRADQALNNPSGFNGELANAVLCVVEETNLSKRGYASDRIKDWVTGRTINVHKKSQTPYDIPNCTHWIQCANDSDYCPVFPGDTRITTIKLERPSKDIPKPELLEDLEKESSSFIYTLLNFEIPPAQGRLAIPVIETEEKRQQMEFNTTSLARFLEDETYLIDGASIKYGDFYAKFQGWLDPIERIEWTTKRVAKCLPVPRGKMGGNGQLYIGNISFDPQAELGSRLRVSKGRLV